MVEKYVANSFVISSWKKPAEIYARGTTINNKIIEYPTYDNDNLYESTPFAFKNPIWFELWSIVFLIPKIIEINDINKTKSDVTIEIIVTIFSIFDCKVQFKLK